MNASMNTMIFMLVLSIRFCRRRGMFGIGGGAFRL